MQRSTAVVRPLFGLVSAHVNNSFPEVCRDVSASIAHALPAGEDVLSGQHYLHG
jgi:hypothetical protein